MKALVAALLLAFGALATGRPVTVTVTKHQQIDGTHLLVHEAIVDAPRADVWRAVSTAEGWKEWAAPLAWTPPDRPDLIETSYTPGARPGDASTIRQQVLLRLPERLMIFRTVKAPKGFAHFDTFTNVLSVVELDQVGERRTRVSLIGSPYPNTDAGRRLLGFFEKGNTISLDRLRARFARPARARAATR